MYLYSFLDIRDLVVLIKNLSICERNYLKNFTEYLDQKRGLKIILDNLHPKNMDDAIYAIKVCSHLELSIKDLDSAKEAYFNLFLSKALKRNIACKVQFHLYSNQLFEKFDAKKKVL